MRNLFFFLSKSALKGGGGRSWEAYEHGHGHTSVSGRFLGMINQNFNVCNSNRLQVVVFQFCFINLRYIPKLF